MNLPFSNNCSELALSLSQNYYNTEPYIHNKERDNMDHYDLKRYLNTHGILLTMCFPDSCILPMGETQHVSSSWINSNLGLQIIPSDIHVGLVLDPSKASIHCIYPTDAASNTRDDAGCGPRSQDAKFGSSYKFFVNRYLARRGITKFKNLNFGMDTKWTDIDCQDFIEVPFGVENVQTWYLEDDTDLDWNGSSGSISSRFVNQSMFALMQSDWQSLMGHEVCQVPNTSEIADTFIYSGAASWEPIDWQDVVDMQLDLLKTKKSEMGVWNEVVLELPLQMEDIVSAVFYIDDSQDHIDRKLRQSRALSEARILGNKPVFALHVNHNNLEKNLFTCIQEREDFDESGSITLDKGNQVVSVMVLRKIPPLHLEKGGLASVDNARTNQSNENCAAVAATLSQNYNNTLPFEKGGDGDLQRYLNTHGNLLTMCFPTSCIVGMGETHISSSWINADLGVQTIPSPLNVGLVLNASKTQVRCMYPTDGLTETRENSGCGPFMEDPRYGSLSRNIVARYFTRQAITHYKNLNFGIQTKWEDIDCRDFVQLMFRGEVETWYLDDYGSMVNQSVLELVQGQYQGIMGHQVCSLPTNETIGSDLIIYSGAVPWAPTEWQEMVDIQLGFLNSTMRESNVWNEIVLDLPSEMKDIVSAIFYVDDDDADNPNERALRRMRARSEAQILGNKPVLALNMKKNTVNQNIFTCDEENEPTDEGGKINSNSRAQEVDLPSTTKNASLRFLRTGSVHPTTTDK